MTRSVVAMGALVLFPSLAACNGGGSGADAGPGGDGRVLAESTLALCQNGQDDDGDGFADCQDQDCWVFSACEGIRPDGGGPWGDGSALDGSVPPPACGATTCTAGEACVEGKCVAAGPAAVCGGDPFGDVSRLPTDNDGTFYVLAGHTGATSDGSESAPFTTIGDALVAIPAGKKYTVVVGPGTYDEALEIGVRGQETFAADLYCRCPDQVRIAQPVTVRSFLNAGEATSIRVTIDGCQVSPKGFDLATATTWAASCGAVDNGGINAIGDSTHVLVRDSVVAGWCAGIYFSATDGAIVDASICVARSRLAGNLRGLDAQSAPLNHNGSPFSECQQGTNMENIALVQSLVDQNRDYGVRTQSRARGILLAGNIVQKSGQLGGTIAAQPTAPEEDGPGHGVYLGDTESAVVSHNVVRDNQNRGIGLRNESFGVSQLLIVEGNQVLNNRGAGIALQKLMASRGLKVLGNTVTGTQAIAGQPGGDGIQASIDAAASYLVDLSGNTVSDSARHGVFYDGVDGTIGNNTVKRSGGYGCVLQQSAATVGTNAWSDNLGGDVQNYSSPVEKYGSLPIPIP